MTTKLEKTRELLALWGQPEYRWRQVCQAVFGRRVRRFDDMTALPLPLRERLRGELGESVLTARAEKVSRAPQAEKVLFRFEDGAGAETVRLRFRARWESYCVSSQCGCALGCKFCATGSMGPGRNLTAWEIAEELLYFHLRGRGLDSVSFMGMGEPLANPRVFEALELLTDPRLFGLSRRRVTVSTVGVLPNLRRMTAEWPQVNLAYSLHAPTPALRKKLMPVESRWPMERVLEALDLHIKKTRRRVFLAYILLDHINDSPAHARQLVLLLRRRPAALPLYHVELIPCNGTDRSDGLFRPPDKKRTAAFLAVLKEAGVSCSVRAQFGGDVAAACGQLAVSQMTVSQMAVP